LMQSRRNIRTVLEERDPLSISTLTDDV